MKYVFNTRWNTLKHVYSGDSIRYFNILPSLEFYYDSRGFFEVGPSTMNDWCKELTISFSFLCIRMSFQFYWKFYKIYYDENKEIT
jgi:hypothetical protein